MKIVGAFEAKTHLPRLLQEVARGETIIITRHGVPVAVLGPPGGAGKRNPAAAVKALRDFQEQANITLGGLTLREMIEEGRH